jgi:hypothetical protein
MLKIGIDDFMQHIKMLEYEFIIDKSGRKPVKVLVINRPAKGVRDAEDITIGNVRR